MKYIAMLVAAITLAGCGSAPPAPSCHGTARPVNQQPTSTAALTCEANAA